MSTGVKLETSTEVLWGTVGFKTRVKYTYIFLYGNCEYAYSAVKVWVFVYINIFTVIKCT